METDIPEHPLEKNNIVLDPLPYVDEYTSEMQEEVQALLKQEMKYYTYEESGNIYTPTPLEVGVCSASGTYMTAELGIKNGQRRVPTHGIHQHLQSRRP